MRGRKHPGLHTESCSASFQDDNRCKNTDFIRYFYYFCELDKQKEKVIKKALKIFWLTIVSILAIIFATSLTIQLPQVQTFIAQKVVDNISDKIQGNIEFEKIHFKPFTTLILKNVLITDRNPVPNPRTGEKVDTFFNAQYIIAKFTLEGLFKDDNLHFDKVFISNAQMNLVLEDLPESINGKDGAECLTRIFGIKKKQEKIINENEIFHIKKVEIHNMGFHMFNHREKEIRFDGGINWNDLDVRNININARDLQFKDGVMSGTADKVSFVEKSGWKCLSVSASTRVGRGRAIIENLKLRDKWSDLNLPLYMMSFNCPEDFTDYICNIKMDAEISSSTLDFRTLQYFAPQLGDNRLKASVSGKMSGYVNDFTVSDVVISSYAGGFSGTVNGRIKGIPEIERTSIDARLSKCLLTADGLGKFLNEWNKGNDLDLSGFAKGITFAASGRAYGPLDHLNTDINIYSLIGKAEAELRLDNILSANLPLGLSGSVSTKDLDAGRIAGTEIVRQVSMEAGFQANLGRGLDFPEVVVDSLIVDRAFVNGYDYSSLTAAGEIKEESFTGKVICEDPSLDFYFNGTVALSPKDTNAVYDFTANLGYANLHAMNIDKRGKSEISFSSNASFTSKGGSEVIGEININNLTLANEEDTYRIGDIDIQSFGHEDNYRLSLNSSFAEATYSGSAAIAQFVKDMQGITFVRELPALFKNTEYEWIGNEYKVDFVFHNMIGILAYVMPGLYIESGTSITANVDKGGMLDGSINSGRLAFKKQYLKGLAASINNRDENLTGDILCDEVQVASLKLSDNHLQIFANDNHIGAGYTYDNHSELENSGEFIIHGDLARENDSLALALDIKQSMLYLNSRQWNILPSHVKIKGQDISVDSFCLSSDEQAILIDGATSASHKDTLVLSLQRFDVSIANSLVPGLGLKGALTGTARLTSPMDKMGVDMRMICDSTHIADIPLGILRSKGSWNNEAKSLTFDLRNELDGKTGILANGSIYPKDGRLDTRASLDRLNVGYVQPLLKEVFSEMKGYISGDIVLQGQFDNMDIVSTDGRLEEGMLRVAYTNVPYFADGTFHIDSKGAYFDDIKIRDSFNGTGEVTGAINWDHFRDITFDTKLRVDQIEGINLTEEMSETFYGNIFGTGNIAITGPSDNLSLTIDAVTAKAGQLHIPITAGANAGQTNLLKFTELETDTYVDPYEVMMTTLQKKEEKASDVNVRLRVNAQPEVEAFVEIDKASGNVLSGRGSGIIDLEVGTDIFNINGDYTLSGGNYKFVAMGLVSRDFEIQDGSSIRFKGDILESTLDINALYKTKASLSTLIADTTSVANRRTVECGISITEQLSNPRLSFSIEIPDLDPTIKSRVESALSTEDKVQKQFLSLILSNSFLPDEQSGIANNSSMLYSNVTEMLANQLSNIFQKLDIPLDLGLNYQPSDKGNDIFDVAVSTQLFNNRVVVNGSVGNKQYSSGGTQDVVGDLDIEIKIDRSGSFRLNLFSHSADSYTNYLDNSQRNGVGLTYQTEFNHFGQFFRNIFSSKAKRQAAKMAEEQAMIDGGRVDIEIKSSPEKPKKK